MWKENYNYWIQSTDLLWGPYSSGTIYRTNLELWEQYLGKMTLHLSGHTDPKSQSSLGPATCLGPTFNQAPLFCFRSSSPVSSLLTSLGLFVFYLYPQCFSWRQPDLVTSHYRISHDSPLSWEKITQLLGRRFKATATCHQTPHFSWNSPVPSSMLPC